MNYDQMTLSEMEEIYSRLGKEIEKRRDAEEKEDWKKLVSQIRLFIKRHGGISVINGTDEEEDCINCEAKFDDPGMIYLPDNLRWR